MPTVKLTGYAASKIELAKRIGAGCFGEVYKGKDLETGIEVAIKLEELRTSAPQLAFEYDVSKKLIESSPSGPPQGFALPCQFFENVGRHCAMVMPLLGCSLENMIERCDGKFGAKTTLMIAEQIVRRLEYLHSLGIVHRDIKPENFMLGKSPTAHHVYLIDFGLSRAYWDSTGHRPERTKLSLTGTARYASIKAHQGYEQSRRDDLEAAGYMMVYFLRGAMPWSGLAAKTKQEKFARIAEVKISTKLDELCAGHPDCFKEYIEKSRALKYTERPDYATFHKAFRDAFTGAGYVEDYSFDWDKGKVPPGLVPIGDWVSPRQPDDPADAAMTSSKSTAGDAGDACEKANQIIKRRSQAKMDEMGRIRTAFESWDKNNDGGIDKEEFKEVLGSIGVPAGDLSGMFEKADLNHDGRINFEEFMVWINGDIPVQVREEVYAGHGDHEGGSTKGKDEPEHETAV